MMLRSASTPSLVSSFTERKHTIPSPTAAHHTSGQVSCNTHVGFHNEATEIRRAQSADNLEEIFNVSFHADGASTLSRQSSKRLSRMTTLETIPSYHPSDDDEAEEGDDDDDDDYVAEGDWSQLFTVQNLAAHELNGFRDVGKMYLAAGIGVNAIDFLDEAGFGGGSGGGGICKTADDYRDGGDSRDLSLENHYKNMLLQCPGNPLFLRNYAHFLYQTKGDLVAAEVYYSRAILADPEDGEILCEYAKVIWELNHDKEKARSYFERAVQASSEDSNVSASYASFLWDVEDEDEDDVKQDRFLHPGIMASATA